MNEFPDPDQAVELSTEPLALLLLQRVADGGRPFGRDNFIGGEISRSYDIYSDGPRPTVEHGVWAQKISEAFDWLLSNGLLVRDASQGSDNWVVLSEIGRQALSTADPQRFLDTRQLLAVRMHPRLERKVRSLFTAGELETAVFTAAREVEIAVRTAAGFDKDRLVPS